jgi:membrane associated rhomboid family serine protease
MGMDATEASNALTEIDQRSRQTLRQGSPRLPGWYIAGSAVAVAILSASQDLTGPLATAMLIGAGLVLVGLAVALERFTGVRLRMRVLRWGPVILFFAAVMGTAIVVGTALRLYDVSADATIAGIAAAAVWAATVNRCQAAAIGKPA